MKNITVILSLSLLIVPAQHASLLTSSTRLLMTSVGMLGSTIRMTQQASAAYNSLAASPYTKPTLYLASAGSWWRTWRRPTKFNFMTSLCLSGAALYLFNDTRLTRIEGNTNTLITGQNEIKIDIQKMWEALESVGATLKKHTTTLGNIECTQSETLIRINNIDNTTQATLAETQAHGEKLHNLQEELKPVVQFSTAMLNTTATVTKNAPLATGDSILSKLVQYFNAK